MLLMIISLAQAQKLVVNDLNRGNGYTIIQIGEKQLIDNYTKILHIFNTTKYKNYVDDLKLEASQYDNTFINHQLEHITNQLKGLKISHKRHKRGFINILGKG